MVLPVPGPGFRGRFWTGLGRKPNADRQKTGPTLPGPKAQGVSRFAAKTGPELAPEAWSGDGSTNKQPKVDNVKLRSLWILGSGPKSTLPEAEIGASILTVRPPPGRGKGFDLI